MTTKGASIRAHRDRETFDPSKYGLTTEQWAALSRKERNKYHARAWKRENRERVREHSRRYRNANQRKEAERLHRYYLAKRGKIIAIEPRYAEARQRELMKIDIYAVARRSLPAGLPAFVRDDVITDVVLAHLEGKLAIGDVPKRAGEFLKSYNRLFDQWKTVSLDATIPGTDGITYMDRVAAAPANEGAFA